MGLEAFVLSAIEPMASSDELIAAANPFSFWSWPHTLDCQTELCQILFGPAPSVLSAVMVPEIWCLGPSLAMYSVIQRRSTGVMSMCSLICLPAWSVTALIFQMVGSLNTISVR